VERRTLKQKYKKWSDRRPRFHLSIFTAKQLILSKTMLRYLDLANGRSYWNANGAISYSREDKITPVGKKADSRRRMKRIRARGFEGERENAGENLSRTRVNRIGDRV